MKLKFWLGIAISLICLFLVFRGIDFAKVFEAMKSVNYLFILVSIILQLATIWLRAERWKYLLMPIKSLTFKHLVPATMIGFMANNILPARAGEFIRAYVIGKKEKISKTSAFATIVIERVFDMMTMLGFLLVVILTMKFPETSNGGGISNLLSESALEKIGLASALFVFGLLAFLILLKEFPNQTTQFITTICKPLPTSLAHKALEFVNSFRVGLRVLDTRSHIFWVIFWSLAVWFTAILAGWSVLRAFNLHLSFLAVMFINVIIAFSAALPSSPGYVGPFHAAVSAGVLFFLPTLDKSTVAGIAIIFHLSCIVPITLAGLYYLWKENMSIAEIQHVEQEEEHMLQDQNADSPDTL